MGIWKDYQDLEDSLSLTELNATLAAKRDSDYQQQKFQAALKGVDLDKESSRSNEPKSFQEYASSVLSKKAGISNDDILSLQGEFAEKAGIGIGMGIDAEMYDAAGNRVY